MTASSAIAAQARQPHPSRSGGAAKAIVASTFVLFLLVLGITLLALAVAFPMVGPIVRDRHLTVPAGDLQLAGTLAGYWWAFAIAGVNALAAAVVVAVLAIRHLDPTAAE